MAWGFRPFPGIVLIPPFSFCLFSLHKRSNLIALCTEVFPNESFALRHRREGIAKKLIGTNKINDDYSMWQRSVFRGDYNKSLLHIVKSEPISHGYGLILLALFIFQSALFHSERESQYFVSGGCEKQTDERKGLGKYDVSSLARRPGYVSGFFPRCY